MDILFSPAVGNKPALSVLKLVTLVTLVKPPLIALIAREIILALRMKRKSRLLKLSKTCPLVKNEKLLQTELQKLESLVHLWPNLLLYAHVDRQNLLLIIQKSVLKAAKPPRGLAFFRWVRVSQSRGTQGSFLLPGGLLSLVDTGVATPGCPSDFSLIFFFLTCIGTPLTLYTSLQAVAVQVHARTLVTVCSVYLPPHDVIS
ncbi:hypothetical protein AVEN_68060-1 [Araneus ventricosus]|uniref:Uncharacterized protein n=1 Tax=Araneus ventricosus TaxID=182803 RepID=A0A4Y2M6K6_ARAVE|nr:hypothetical protein AVEN_68060-1 [Araneus ventricosus]